MSASDEVAGAFGSLPTPPAKYDPANEAALRRAVSRAFDYLRNSARAPRLASVDLFFDASTDQVTLRAVGGTQHRSARFEIADNSNFTGASVNEVVNMGPGDVVSRSTSSLSGSDRGKVWYGRVTPYSGANGTGQAGTAMQDSDYVPLQDIFGYVREVPSETTDTATLTLIPFSEAVFDSIQTRTQIGNGSWSSWGTVTVDGSGNYVTNVSLIEKHPSKIAYRVYLNGAIVQENVVTFDQGTESNVVSLSASYDGAGEATVTANFDSDTETGVGNGEYSTNAGGLWTAFEVLDDRSGSFTVTQSTSAATTVWVRGYNSAVVAGPYRVIVVDPFVSNEEFPHANAYRSEDGDCSVATRLEVTIEWGGFPEQGGDTYRIQKSENGGSWSTLDSGLSGVSYSYEYGEDVGATRYEYAGPGAFTTAYRVQLRRSSTTVAEVTTNNVDTTRAPC